MFTVNYKDVVEADEQGRKTKQTAAGTNTFSS